MTKQPQREVEEVFSPFCASADVPHIRGFRLICLSPVAEPSAAMQARRPRLLVLNCSGKLFTDAKLETKSLREKGKKKKVMDGTFS